MPPSAQSEGRAAVSEGPQVTNELPWHVQPIKDIATRLSVDPMVNFFPFVARAIIPSPERIGDTGHGERFALNLFIR